MRKTECIQSKRSFNKPVSLILGALLAFGIALTVLFLGAVAVSSGILKPDAADQITALACLVGTFIGGSFVAAQWEQKRLLVGFFSGLICFALILVVALISNGGINFGTQALIELAACTVGGGLAGFAKSRKKKRRKGKRVVR